MGVPRSLNPLRHDETQIAERLRSVSIVKLAGHVQGLYEVLLGKPCPGAQTQLFAHHDHCRRGIPLPRQTQWCMDSGDNVSDWAWNNNFASGSTDYWYRPLDGGSQLSYDSGGTGTRNIQGPANFHVYVTPNIDSDKTAVSTNPCYLSVGLLFTSTYACDLRFYNRTRKEAGAAVAIPAAATVVNEATLTIPCVGGVVNEIDIEMKCGTISNTIILHQMYIAETRSVSQPQTAGTVVYTTTTRP